MTDIQTKITNAIRNFGAGEEFLFVIPILLLTNLAILLNIPILRQILGFFFLTILPGLLILQILKLNKINSTEKFVLSVGLSISFLMFFGLLINNLLFSLGYKTPLSMITLLISFNIAFVILAAIGYKANKEPFLSLPNYNLTTTEKAFLVLPLLFPALSIFGMHVMNTTDNNIILMFLLFSIPTYVVSVCFFNHKFPKRLYPVVIFLISISLLLLMALRSNHIIGVDIHSEYYYFKTTLGNLHWGVSSYSILNALLSITLLPTIYQSILNINPESLFKTLYSLLFSIFPLAIYILSKKYVGDSYAFLAAFFTMSQVYFLNIAQSPRTSLAVLFVALAFMTLFSDRIYDLKRRILFIVFMASIVVSHYSTTYIFFLIMFGVFIGIEIVSRKYAFKKMISLTFVMLFFSVLFFWYSQLTMGPFDSGVRFGARTFNNLNMFFTKESMSDGPPLLLGKGIIQMSIIHQMEFVLTWMMFGFIGIGMITLIIKYKEMLSFPELNFKKPEFLNKKFEVEYLMSSLACISVLVSMIVLPYVSVGYGMTRLYAVTTPILSILFVLGGVILSKNLSLKKKGLTKKQEEMRKSGIWKGEKNGSQQTLGELDQNASQVRVYLIILLVLIPYFLSVTNVTYNIAGIPRSILLNSEGIQYDTLYVHDQESYGAKWLKNYMDMQNKVAAYSLGEDILISQGMISKELFNGSAFVKRAKTEDYIYLRYSSVVDGILMRIDTGKVYNMTDYSDMFIRKGRIYNNGGSEVWK